MLLVFLRLGNSLFCGILYALFILQGGYLLRPVRYVNDVLMDGKCELMW